MYVLFDGELSDPAASKAKCAKQVQFSKRQFYVTRHTV